MEYHIEKFDNPLGDQDKNSFFYERETFCLFYNLVIEQSSKHKLMLSHLRMVMLREDLNM
jgi:hypothetical protein